jgi:hypothetical protein
MGLFGCHGVRGALQTAQAHRGVERQISPGGSDRVTASVPGVLRVDAEAKVCYKCCAAF